MTYRQLLTALQHFSETALNRNVSVYCISDEKFYPVAQVDMQWAPDVLDFDIPLLIIK